MTPDLDQLHRLKAAFDDPTTDWKAAGRDLVGEMIRQYHRMRELAESHARLKDALEHLAAPDMWEQVEGMVFGPDLPDGHSDPLIWLGGEHPFDIARNALVPGSVVERGADPG